MTEKFEFLTPPAIWTLASQFFGIVDGITEFFELLFEAFYNNNNNNNRMAPYGRNFRGAGSR